MRSRILLVSYQIYVNLNSTARTVENEIEVKVAKLPSAWEPGLWFIGLGEYSTIASSGLHDLLLPENASAGQ